MKIIKKTGKVVEAYQLGNDSDMERALINSGRIIKHSSGKYELFSQESVNGSGELAENGDYFKVDSAGFPYPNSKEFFEQNHKHIEDNKYEQLPKELTAWSIDEPENDVIQFLIENKGLVIDKNSTEKYYSAPLWGSMLSAAKDAVIVFYDVKRNPDGDIVDVDFNFVAREEFERTYDVIK